MFSNQVSVIVYFNLLLRISVTAEKSYKTSDETRNENIRPNGKDPFIASVSPNREKTLELLEKNIDKSALTEKFYSDQLEKILLKEFSGVKKKLRRFASDKYLDNANNSSIDIELTQRDSSGHSERIQKRHNRLRHAKRKKLDELRWVKEAGKNLSSERNFSSKKYLANEKNVRETRGKNHKKFRNKKYSLNDREIFNSLDDRHDKELNWKALLNLVDGYSEKNSKNRNLSTTRTRWKSQFAKDLILNSNYDLQVPRDEADDPSRNRLSPWEDKQYDIETLVESNYSPKRDRNNYLAFSKAPSTFRLIDNKEKNKPNESSSINEAISFSGGEVTPYLQETYHKTLPFGNVKSENSKYNSKNRVFQESSANEQEEPNKFDVAKLLNTDPFVIPDSSRSIDDHVSRSKLMSLKRNSSPLKYSSKFDDKIVPSRLDYGNSLYTINPDQTSSLSKQNCTDASKSSCKVDATSKDYQSNKWDSNVEQNKLLNRQEENPYPEPFTWKNLFKLLIKKPTTNIRIRKSKRLYDSETNSTSAQYMNDQSPIDRQEIKKIRERSYPNISQTTFQKCYNVTPQCRFIDSFRKSIMASCQRQGQNPIVPEQLIQEPCYSIRDLLVVVVMTSLVNLLAGIIITLAFCCLPLRECCFLAHGSRVTLTTRNMQSGLSRSHSEEDSSGSVGCLEACLPDISYQRHIARGGFSKGRTFGMAQMFQQLTGSIGESCPWERHHRRLRKDSMLISRRSLSLEDLSIT